MIIKKGEMIRVYLDDVEEWKVYTVKEVLEKTKLGNRYLLENSDGNTLVRIVDFNNTQKRFGAKPIKKIKSGADIDWMIHYVFDKEGVSIHTHGMNKYIERELEMTLPLPQDKAMEYLNIICLDIARGKLDIYDYAELEKETLFACPIRFIKCNEFFADENPAEVFRVIFPDANYLFPEDEKCDINYKKQVSDIK